MSVFLGKLVAQLHDREYQENYVLKDNQRGLSISVDDVMFITDTWFLTSDDDYIMRVWDINTGSEENTCNFKRKKQSLNFLVVLVKT